MKTGEITISVIIGLFLVVLVLWGCPQYNVYKQRKEGEAQLAHATYSREVAVAEAKAKMEGATLLAQADTIRAHGIARSNQIIGQSLSEAYLHYFWIDNLDKSNQVIYVPTESNLPIMEAGRFYKNNQTDSSN
jgi:predicted aminopeptidase